LWAQGTALQCCFHQQSLDLLIPVYSGPVADGSKFDLTMLSTVVVQVTNTIAGNKKAGAVQQIGIPHDPCQPLPYIALLLELGTKILYKESKSKREVNVPTPICDVRF
jgi:hypothetical protein